MMLVKSVASLLATASCVFGATINGGGKHLKRDVIVVGGGASGAHAAIRLREDMGKSIVLIEKEAILGGHIDTYIGPSGTSYEYGVQNFLNVDGAKDFFARFGIKTKVPGRVARTPRYVDFTTGSTINYTNPARNDMTATLTRYAEICAKYEKYMLPSFWNFPAPEDIPEELLMNFGDFVEKHDLYSMVPTLFQITGFGVGDVTKSMTLWVMQAFGGPMARSMLGQLEGFVPESGRNQDLYDAIAKTLGDDVLYSSTVIRSKRSDKGVVVTVTDANGEMTTISAKRLLLAIEPTSCNLAPFDLDETEEEVFAKFQHSNVYAGIVANPALPREGSLTNLPSTAAPNNYDQFPQGSFTIRFDWLGTEEKDLFRIMVIGEPSLNQARAKELVQADFERIVKAGTLNASGSTKLEWVQFASHGAMHMRVSEEELMAGFIQDLYGLQGGRSTWFTGGAWVAQFQTHLWLYNNILLPKLTEGI